MNRKIVGFVVATAILASVHLAQAQQPKKIYRIGYLSPVDAARESTGAEAVTIPPEVLARADKVIR
ncbi:MAG: hypothetical protein ACREQA_12940 [Candidatus Binatia bacterium]